MNEKIFLSRIIACLTVLIILFHASYVAAKKKNIQSKILYIPHDNRPIVAKQTAEILEKAGIEIVMPPEKFLGDQENYGDPDLLWAWLNENATKDLTAAVISSDALLYGTLVGSRKHQFDSDEILARTDLFENFRKHHKKLPLYVFGSIMRTPRSGLASGHAEPDYYQYYGANIFRLTALMDKKELDGLTQREIKEFNFLQRLIPNRAIEDWMGRRDKNFIANKKLIDSANKKVFDYLILGRDDNAPYSQTHNEGRKLAEYGRKTKNFMTMAGIDEIGLILLTRAINDLTKSSPKIFVQYNWGRAGDTIPAYSDEKIDNSIREEIIATGATLTEEVRHADLVLAVNTNPDGETFEANTPLNVDTERPSTKYFANTVKDLVKDGHKVIVADVAFANGSDNSLMTQLQKQNLLFKLNAYGGWNTATNSSGFALATGILSTRMKKSAIIELLLHRYIDDWAYQANVRQIVNAQLKWSIGDGRYESLNEKYAFAAENCEELIRYFAKNNLSNVMKNDNIRVKFPWNRMFEADISF